MVFNFHFCHSASLHSMAKVKIKNHRLSRRYAAIYKMRTLLLLILAITVSGCIYLDRAEWRKRAEIREALHRHIESGSSNLSKYSRYVIKKCEKTCEGSSSSNYYLEISTNACFGWVDIEETCSGGKCLYIFKENELMVCS